jgi:hypothetical protein
MEKSVIYTHEVLTRSGRAFANRIKWMYPAETDRIGTQAEATISVYDNEDQTTGITIPVLQLWQQAEEQFRIVKVLDPGDLPEIELEEEEVVPTKYTVELYRNLNTRNGGSSESETFEFESESEAMAKANELLTIEDDEPGVSSMIQVWTSNGDEPFGNNDLFCEERESKAINPDAIIVLFCHTGKGMNYAYDIKSVEIAEKTAYEKMSDLPYSDDSLYVDWAAIYEDIDELEEAYESGDGIFGKIHSGSSKVREFIEEYRSEIAEQMAEESESLPRAIEIVLERAKAENIGAYIQGGVIFNSAGCVLYDPEHEEASEKKLWDFAYGE